MRQCACPWNRDAHRTSEARKGSWNFARERCGCFYEGGLHLMIYVGNSLLYMIALFYYMNDNQAECILTMYIL